MNEVRKVKGSQSEVIYIYISLFTYIYLYTLYHIYEQKDFVHASLLSLKKFYCANRPKQHHNILQKNHCLFLENSLIAVDASTSFFALK